MQVKIFTMGFNSVCEAFDDNALQQFVRDKELLGMRDHFFMRHGQPYLTVVVSYRQEPEPLTPETRKNKEDQDWRKLLAENEAPLFNTLREWRNARSQREGLPPYIICTNRQLAEIVKLRPQSMAALGGVDGFGAKKLEKYGREIISLCAEEMTQPEIPTPVSEPEQLTEIPAEPTPDTQLSLAEVNSDD